MKKSIVLLSLSLVGAATALFVPGRAIAQTNAYDDAYHYSHASATWYTNFTGKNYGFGFTPWVLTTNGPGSHGFFTTRNATPKPAIASPTNSVDAPGNDNSAHVIGMFANGTGFNSSVAYRGFSNSLDTTVAFKIQWESIGIGGSGQLGGFVLRNGNATNSVIDYTNALRFAFYYISGAGSNSFTFWDGNGIQFIGIPFASNPLACEFTVKPGDQYRFVVRSLNTDAILAILDNQPLAGSGSIDSFALFAHQTTGGNQNFNRFQVVSTSLTPPTVLNVSPPNGAIYQDAASTNVSFEVNALGSTISSNGVSLYLNNVLQTNLLISTTSPTTQLFVTNNVPLAPNTSYNVTIVAIDSNGNRATNTSTFNTWRSDAAFIEAEDYNYSSGGFIPNSFPNPYGTYNNLLGVNGIDFGESDPAGNNNAYRPGDLPQVQPATDLDHAGYAGFFLTDYNLAYIQHGEWLNYTRIMSNVTYTVYARAAGFGGNGVMAIEHLADPTATASNQPLASLGTCVIPHTGGAQVYTFVPLTDFFSQPVQIHFPGTNTFRTTAIGDDGSYNLGYLIFVPNSNTNSLKPYLSAGYPYPGATAVPLETPVFFTIANRDTAVNPASVQVYLDGTNITSNVTLSNNAAGTLVTYVSPKFLAPNATHSLAAVFADNAGSPTTTSNYWLFTTVNALYTILPPGDALPIGTSTTPGFGIKIYKIEDAAPTIAQIATNEMQLAGMRTNPVTSQPYPNLANGGPNADGSYAETNSLNYDITATPTGTPAFPFKSEFPYVPAGSPNNNIALEARMYLQLTNGNYVFVVRSDDGCKLTEGPTTTNLLLGQFDGGRGNGTPSIFYATVLTNGLYPMRLFYYQAGSGGNLEFYTLNNGTPVLVNDSTNATSIKAFQILGTPAAPVALLNPAHSGNTTTFSFLTQSGHTHYVEFKTSINDVNWTPLTTIGGNGSMTNVTDSGASNSTRFYRVNTQ